MGLERIGLGGVLTFDERQAVQATGRARDAYGRFVRTTDQLTTKTGRLGMVVGTAMRKMAASARLLGRGLNQIGMGLGRLGMAGLPVSYMMYRGAKSAANFEQAMLDLGARARASEKDMSRLTKKAKEMGIVTAFSASESAKALEMLAVAGATVEEQIGGVRGVLDLAAAGNVHYAQASQIVSNITRGMGREFARSSNLADILALASSSATVTVESLGESFSYGMAQARIMGLETEELTALFGKLGDASITGSRAGTSLNRMLAKLADPSEKAQRIFDKWNITMTDSTGRMKPVSTIVGQISKKLNRLTSVTEKSKIMNELFGEYGKKAYFGLAAAGKESIDTLTEKLKKASEGIGVASRMAQERLKGTIGAFKMLSASVEGLSIEMYGPVLKSVSAFVKEATGGLNNVLLTLQVVREVNMDTAEGRAKMAEAEAKYGKTALQVALGLGDAIDWLKKSWNGLVQTVKDFGKWIGASEGGIRSFVATAVKIATITAIAAPLLLIFKGMAFVLGGLVPIVKGLGLVFRASFGWVGLVIGGIVALVAMFTEKVEHVDAATGKLTTQWKIFGEDAGVVLNALLMAVKDLFKEIGESLQGLAMVLEYMGVIERKRKVVATFGEPVRAKAPFTTKKIARQKATAESLVAATAGGKSAKEMAESKDLLKQLLAQQKKNPCFDVNVTSKLNLDGRDVSSSVSRVQGEIMARAGAKSKPWSRRMMLEHGAMPATATGR